MDNFVSSRDKIGAPSTEGGKLGTREESSQQAVLALKQDMSTQLCGLLVCALQCLKGGQTFQYSSLLIVNLIIDSFIRFEASTIPINWRKVFDFDFTQLGLDATDNAAENASKSMLNEKGEKHLSSAISAAAHIGKHFRNLRINESFNFKQNFTNKEEKVRELKQTGTEGKVPIEPSVPKKA